jgi:hypothetical protein
VETPDSPSSAPDGYCLCGCGGRTPIARSPNKKTGRKKGEPCFFLPGPHNRKTLRYIEMAMGYETPCWRCQLAINRDGYAVCWDGKGRMSQLPAPVRRFARSRHRGRSDRSAAMGLRSSNPRQAEGGIA